MTLEIRSGGQAAWVFLLGGLVVGCGGRGQTAGGVTGSGGAGSEATTSSGSSSASSGGHGGATSSASSGGDQGGAGGGASCPKGCDDGDPCTADSCDPKTGCAHAPL